MKRFVVHESLAAWRAARQGPDFAGNWIGFVPTMGALHAGHRSLLERASAENDRVVLSIFVNPTQFNDPKDFAKYPQPLAQDLELAREFATDVIVPTREEIYPDNFRYVVDETRESRNLEGAFRPGHFAGVLTVVLKLLNLVQAQRAYFGEKDWQQLQLVRGLAKAFFLPTEIIPCPTVRAADDLALSSRNARLSADGRRLAAQFPKILRQKPEVDAARAELERAGFGVDYVAAVPGGRVAAVRVEGVRLLDYVRD